MRTFSEIIDIAIATTKLPNYLQYAISAANSIIQDLNTNHDSAFDLSEVRINVPIEYSQGYHGGGVYGLRARPAEQKILWETPSDFRSIQAIELDNTVFATNRKPGLVQRDSSYYWYQSGETICIFGVKHHADIAYYRMHKQFIYFPPDKRLLQSSDQYGYQIRSHPTDQWRVYQGTADEKTVYDRSVNWVVRDYGHDILDGLLSRLFNVSGNLDRGGRMHNTYVSAKDKIHRSPDSHLSGEI